VARCDAHGDEWETVPCLEPRGPDEEPDRYSGDICDSEASYVVWGGRGAEQGFAHAYPACEEHARRWGQGYEIGTGELVVFDPDLQETA
jgi:hypothetical protein